MTELTKLKPATQNTLYLSNAVTDRFSELAGSYKRIKGVDLPIQEEMKKTILRWRKMHLRFQAGDYRCSQSELHAVRDVAQWTLDVNCELRNQQKIIMEWVNN